MKKLLRNDVDGCLSVVCEEWDNGEPTVKELADCITQYFDRDEAETAAQELMETDEVDMNDGSCTVFTLL